MFLPETLWNEETLVTRLDKRSRHVLNKTCPNQIIVVFLQSVGAHSSNPHKLPCRLSFLTFRFSHTWNYFLENEQTKTKWKRYPSTFRNVKTVRASTGLRRKPSKMSIPCTTEGLFSEYEIPYLKNPPCFWKQIVYVPVNHCSELLGATKIQKYNLKGKKRKKKEVYLENHTCPKANEKDFKLTVNCYWQSTTASQVEVLPLLWICTIAFS